VSESSAGEPALLNTLKRVATGLKRAGVAFALGGGYAVYARGGPKSEHDVDFVLREDDVERALDVLAQEGLRPVRPPEDWLVKVYDRDRIVDLIYRLNGRPVDQFLDLADEMEVGSVQMPVLSATALVTSRLRALTEHNCDFGAVLPMVRALREQVDWDAVRRDTEDSAYAQAFLVLGERLRLIDAAGGDGGRGARAQRPHHRPSPHEVMS
jgi:hypothetical protein